jgi:hypothetical protein
MITHNSIYIDILIKLKNSGNIFTQTGKVNSAVLRRDWFIKSPIHKEIVEVTNFLDPNSSISERIYCIQNNLSERYKCVCGKIQKFISVNQGYIKTCHKCTRKIGRSWKSCSETKKTTVSNEKKNLVDFITNTKDKSHSLGELLKFIENKKVGIKNHNTQWVNTYDLRHNKPILKKIIELTNYIKFDIDNPEWSKRIYNIYNNTHNGQLCVICNKNNTRYINFLRGYTTCCNTKACVQQYGCKNRVTNHISNIKDYITEQGFEFSIGDNYKGLNSGKLTLKCQKCEESNEYDIADGKWKNIRCIGCYGDSRISFEEKEICKYLESLNVEILENQKILKNYKELDILIPSKNLAIEYNGVLWHSFGTEFPNNIELEPTHKFNHVNKTKECKEKNIQLLQIFSNEWNNQKKKEIWKSIINSKLGISNKIYARKCKILEVNNEQKNNFLNSNHLQGMDNSKIKLALTYDNKIVSMMTFSKPRFNKNYEWEMVRFCNLLNHTVVGGASKLIKYFIKKYNPKNILSYADLRYSDGNLYNTLGFKFVSNTPPSYFYVKSGDIIYRFTAQKYKLSKLLETYDSDKTEVMNMMDNKYRRIWDCGTMLFVLKLEN